MTRNYYRTGNYKPDRSTFSGEIDIEDFNTYSPNKKRLNNQIEAELFQKTLLKKKKENEMEEKYKNMTLEELKEMKLISNTNGRPISTLTDEKWQKEFNVRKLFVKPYSKKIKRLGQLRRDSQETGYWNEETMGTYHGATNWQEYCSFINDVLRNIRAGQVDYLYYIYQITDLLKFHYDDLKTRYCDGYWEVWLER